MPSTAIVTERVGALDEQYLGRGRPLGASRMLWEIGPDGTDVRELRRRLGLDSGYAEQAAALAARPRGWSRSRPPRPTGASGALG